MGNPKLHDSLGNIFETDYYNDSDVIVYVNDDNY